MHGPQRIQGVIIDSCSLLAAATRGRAVPGRASRQRAHRESSPVLRRYTDAGASPAEVRLEKHVYLSAPDEVKGIPSRRRIHTDGPLRHRLGEMLEGNEPLRSRACWYATWGGGRKLESLSHRLKKNIGFGRDDGWMTRVEDADVEARQPTIKVICSAFESTRRMYLGKDGDWKNEWS